MGHEAGSSRLSVMYRPLASLRANPRNARTHTKAQLRQIADSICAFGFLNPIILDDEGVVLAGHARLAAASSAGLQAVATVRASGLTEAQKRAYVLADNRLA